jgi:hypothetical protein
MELTVSQSYSRDDKNRDLSPAKDDELITMLTLICQTYSHRDACLSFQSFTNGET